MANLLPCSACTTNTRNDRICPTGASARKRATDHTIVGAFDAFIASDIREYVRSSVRAIELNRIGNEARAFCDPNRADVTLCGVLTIACVILRLPMIIDAGADASNGWISRKQRKPGR